MTYFDPARGRQLEAGVDRMVEDWSVVTSATMFGCPSFSAEGTLFAVVVTEGVVLTRLPDELRAEVGAAFDAGPFVAGGRTIEKWLQIRVGSLGDLEDLRDNIRASYDAALQED